MADEKLNLEVVLSAYTQGLDGAAREASLAQDAFEALHRAGQITDETLKTLSRTSHTAERALSNLKKGANVASGGFEAMSADVKALNKELQESARLLVEQGDLSPKSTLAAGMDDATAAQAKAVLEAEKLTIDGVIAERERGAREKERISQRETQIYNDYLDHQRKADANYEKEMAAAAQRLEKIQTDRLERESKESNRQMESRIKAEQNLLKDLNYDAHVKSYQSVEKAKEAASQQTALYNQYLWEEERAAKRVREQNEANYNGYISLRYALYDVASTAFATSAAITGVGVAATAAFGSQEAAFTEVERIAGGSLEEVQNLRDELTRMSTEIPQSFQDLSGIASLGAALDIPAAELDEFTSAVAKFAATTGVTVEAAATGFGKLAAYLKIPEEEFENLGSAILRAGNISVATEEQVLKFAQALALPGARIGFTTDQVVALGATLASFGNINVEGAGSALNRVTKNIERALSESGEDLQTWAATAGMSAEQFKIAWGSDVSGTFNRVIQGLSGDIEGLVGNLDALGIRNVRDQRIIEALALNYGKYNQILQQTTSAWREGTYMNEAYGLVLDDLVSKWGIFQNALTNFAASIGAQVAPSFKAVLDGATALLVKLEEFATSPVGEVVVRMAVTLGSLIAVVTALGGALALAGASSLALRFALKEIAASGMIQALQGVIAAIRTIGTTSWTAAGMVTALGHAFRYLLRATIIGAALYAVSEVLFNTGGAAEFAGNALIALANVGQQVFGALAQSIAQFSPVLANLLAMMGVGFSNNGFASGLRGVGKGLRDWGIGLQKANDPMKRFNESVGDMSTLFDDLDRVIPDATDNVGDFGGAAGQAAKEVRTLVDYANDLRQVWDRAFEIRFSGIQTLDTITSSFISIREAADEAAKRIRDLNNDIRSLSSDISIQEYFLSIAIEYGDTKRAEAIEAELAKKRAELADKTAELQKEQDAASKSLVGNSKGAIENRKQIQSLVQQYQAHIGALAASGMSQDQLAQATARLREDFIRQAAQLGYNRSELEKYAQAFDDVATAIRLIPRDITVTANTNPAVQAFNEMKAAADKASSAVSGLRNNVAAGGFTNPNNAKEIRRMALEAEILVHSRNAAMLSAMGGAANMQGARLSAYEAARLTALLRSGNYYTGGFTGAGGMYEPAGIVHKGEYVIPKRDVNQATGLPYADALGRLMGGLPSRSVAPASSGGNSSAVATVALTAGTIQAIAQATGKVLVLDGKVIAESSSEVYSNQTTVGAY